VSELALDKNDTSPPASLADVAGEYGSIAGSLAGAALDWLSPSEAGGAELCAGAADDAPLSPTNAGSASICGFGEESALGSGVALTVVADADASFANV
jgi:hypothetical protein